MDARKTKSSINSESMWPMHVWFGLGKFTLLSYKHATLLVACTLGMVLTAYFVTIGKFVHSFVLCLAALCLVICLVRFEHVDKLALLEIKVQQLEDESRDVEKNHGHIHDVYHKTRMFADLWQYRTVPRLDILKEMHEMLRDTPQKYIRILLDGFVNQLAEVESCVGPLSLWYGKGALQEEKLKFVGMQLSTCADHLQREHSGDHSAIAKILIQITKPFCLVTVRNFAGHNLVNKDSGLLGDVSDPYIRGRIGHGPYIQTLIISDELNPRWPHEEFLFLTMPEDTLLELSVLDCDSFHRDDDLGTVEIDFRELEPGIWHTKRKKLRGVQRGELEFEICCATRAEHLTSVRDVHFSHSAQAELARTRAVVFRDMYDMPAPDSPVAFSTDSVSEYSDHYSSEHSFMEPAEWVDRS